MTAKRKLPHVIIVFKTAKKERSVEEKNTLANQKNPKSTNQRANQPSTTTSTNPQKKLKIKEKNLQNNRKKNPQPVLDYCENVLIFFSQSQDIVVKYMDRGSLK